MPRTKKPRGVNYSKSQAFTRDTEIPILQPISYEQTYDSNPLQLDLQQIDDDFIDESVPADDFFSNIDDDKTYREKQIHLNEAWQSIRVQLRDALIELESQCDIEENMCPYGKCDNIELFKMITVDCIYFERKFTLICKYSFIKFYLLIYLFIYLFLDEIKIQFNLCNCEQSNLAVALARRGLFPASPIHPSIAFEIKLLEFAEKLLLLAQIPYESFCIALRHIHGIKVCIK